MSTAGDPDSEVEDAVNEVSTIEVLLTEAGLGHVPAEERQRLAQLYPGLRRSLDRFHAIDVGDEVTAALFRADDEGAS